MNVQKVLRFGLATSTAVFLWLWPVRLFRAGGKPNVVSSSPTTLVTATSDPTAGVSCAVRRRHGSTSLPARDSGSRSI